ncbi:MAG: hypothetical protein ACRED2_06490, partial [Methylocella sp.]
RAAASRDFEIQAANTRDVIGKPPDGIALLLPFMLDVSRGRLQCSRAENIALADRARKLLNMRSKAPR